MTHSLGYIYANRTRYKGKVLPPLDQYQIILLASFSLVQK